MSLLDIAEVARQSGLKPSTLRFYEEKGLIESAGRNGLRRQYEPGVVERLALISLGRTAGFTLVEIEEMFGSHGRPYIDRDKLTRKAEELDATIRCLTAMRDGLRKAAVCSADHHFECPGFLRIMREAVARMKRRGPGRCGERVRLGVA